MEETPGKKVLITSDGDEISENIALHLAKRGCRFVSNSFSGPWILHVIIYVYMCLVADKMVENWRKIWTFE